MANTTGNFVASLFISAFSLRHLWSCVLCPLIVVKWMELEADWPEGPHKAQLDALDDLARCPICHDFFCVPLMLSCGHACKVFSLVYPEDIASRCHDFCTVSAGPV